MSEKSMMSHVRKASRWLHRDLSYLFTGALLVYVISGICLNHKRDFNSDYIIKLEEYRIEASLPPQKDGWTEDFVRDLLVPLEEQGNYTKHYFPGESTMKVFLKGGSSLVVDVNTGAATYESIRKRPFFSALNRLHYNPSRAWTVFSDVFAGALIVIILSGLIMIKGPKGLWGRGGVELVLGIAIPVVLFMLL